MGGSHARSPVDGLKFIWLNLWFWSIAPLVTAGFFTVGYAMIVCHWWIGRDWRKTQRLLRRTISWYGATILRVPWPLVRIRFVDLSPEEKPPFVFVCNHPASSDGYLMAFLPFECVQVLNIWPSRIPILRFIARHAGYLKVREMPFEEFLEAGSKLLREGCSVIAFPEGTRSGHRDMGPFHGSAFRLAQHSGVKIVPIALAGNQDIPPRGSALLRPGRVVVTKLPSVTSESHAGMNPYVLKNSVRERIQQYLAEHPV
jgi:1-acyl-sn-glycerol-3-phosphate acyltransferase